VSFIQVAVELTSRLEALAKSHALRSRMAADFRSFRLQTPRLARN
jgi:hypothetical protein